MSNTFCCLCRFVGETPPRTYKLSGVLLHWKVQAHLLSRLSPALRLAYREILGSERIDVRPPSCYGLRGIVGSRPDPAPTVRGTGVLVMDHQVGEVDSPSNPAASHAEDVSEPGAEPPG